MNKPALGKGLDALISGITNEKEKVINIKVELIRPNRYQPREKVDPSQLEELINSIKEKGVIQPILVRRIDNEYELIAGERRWQAVKEAGFKEIPALIKEVTDTELLEIALIENLQRKDLNPIEEARAYQFLLQKFGLSQEDLAKKLGKSRPSITNILRLLKLSQEIQQYISQGTITEGHAKILLMIKDPLQQRNLSEKIIQENLSVKELESLIIKKQKTEKFKSSQKKLDSQWLEIEEKIKKSLATRVQIKKRKKGGILEIEFYSEEDLERILERLKINIE